MKADFFVNSLSKMKQKQFREVSVTNKAKL